MRKLVSTCLIIFTGHIASMAQDQTINGNLSLGQDAGEIVGLGKSLIFGGVQFNSDVISMFRYNRDFNSSDLRINFSDDVETGADRFVIGAQSWVSQVYSPYFIVQSDGKVAIGTEHTGPERLAVNGGIRAKEIKVETANWPDYVFKKGYPLPSLKHTEQYIKDKGHLPGMPSANEVAEKGVSLGEMNVKLLEKIEELTLHLISQEKKTDALLKENALQKKDIDYLKSKLK